MSTVLTRAPPTARFSNFLQTKTMAIASYRTRIKNLQVCIAHLTNTLKYIYSQQGLNLRKVSTSNT